jgi:PKD repeat protein
MVPTPTPEPPYVAPAKPAFDFALKTDYAVAFTNTSFNATRYKWSFGDGRTSTQKDPVHFYSTAGTYRVRLRAYNSEGDYNDVYQDVVVSLIVQKADFTYEQGGIVAYFTDTSTAVGSEVSEWDFGDGTASSERHPSHTFPGNGTYNVTLRRGTFTKTQQITVDAELTLACDDMSADGYRWERSKDGVSGWTEIADTATPSVGITEAVHGVDTTKFNYYRVVAYNAVGDSDYSSVVSQQC